MEPHSLKVRVNKTAFLLRYMKIILPIMIVLVLACFFLMKSASAVFFAVMTAAACIAVIFISVSGGGNAELTFLEKDENRGARVSISARGGSFEVFDIPASDIVIKQTEKQKAFDRGDIRFKNTRLNYLEVDNISAVREFAENYFPKDRGAHQTSWR